MNYRLSLGAYLDCLEYERRMENGICDDDEEIESARGDEDENKESRKAS